LDASFIHPLQPSEGPTLFLPFLIIEQVAQDKLRMNFVSVAGNPQTTGEGVPLFLFVSKDESAINVQVRCDNMELAADIVQDISKFFKIMELESAVNFPQEMEAFEEVTNNISSDLILFLCRSGLETCRRIQFITCSDVS
jgi:hypothetical protein